MKIGQFNGSTVQTINVRSHVTKRPNNPNILTSC
jgi:hypothetical protein